MCAIHAATRPNPPRQPTGSASRHVAHSVRSYAPGRIAHSVHSYKYIGDFIHA
jgi:hypothetical protein